MCAAASAWVCKPWVQYKAPLVERKQQVASFPARPCLAPCHVGVSALAGLPTTREVETAEALGRDVYEYVRQIDYDQVGHSRRAKSLRVVTQSLALCCMLRKHVPLLSKAHLTLHSFDSARFVLRPAHLALQYFDSRAAARDGRLMKQCVPAGVATCMCCCMHLFCTS